MRSVFAFDRWHLSATGIIRVIIYLLDPSYCPLIILCWKATFVCWYASVTANDVANIVSFQSETFSSASRCALRATPFFSLYKNEGKTISSIQIWCLTDYLNKSRVIQPQQRTLNIAQTIWNACSSLRRLITIDLSMPVEYADIFTFLWYFCLLEEFNVNVTPDLEINSLWHRYLIPGTEVAISIKPIRKT